MNPCILEDFKNLWILLGSGKDFHGSVDFGGFGWILVGSGKDFHGFVDFGGFGEFSLDLGRTSMDLWILQDFEYFGGTWEGFPWIR